MGLFKRKPQPEGAPPVYTGLVMRKHARVDAEGTKQFNGLEILSDTPFAIIPTNVVQKGIAEGYITGENEVIMHWPGGPPEDPWRVTHTAATYTKLTFHTIDGDVDYAVVRNPGKHDGEMLWSYLADRVS